mmetsp:Transcript_25486/g.49827  ORF Transcript_25486/g.49827 Transcript_25486/m.49827 type:complete len:199 (+) Transcript_25486:1879-2475(+)
MTNKRLDKRIQGHTDRHKQTEESVKGKIDNKGKETRTHSAPPGKKNQFLKESMPLSHASLTRNTKGACNSYSKNNNSQQSISDKDTRNDVVGMQKKIWRSPTHMQAEVFELILSLIERRKRKERKGLTSMCISVRGDPSFSLQSFCCALSFHSRSVFELIKMSPGHSVCQKSQVEFHQHSPHPFSPFRALLLNDTAST